MPDDQNPQLPLGPDQTPPSPQDANSNNPPPAGGAGGDGPTTPTGPGALFMNSINIEEEMRRSYLDYSMSVIIGRALPDVRDGLKPVHRRILYGMQEMGLQFNKKYTKSAKVVGHVMGNYHPHGDSAIYDTMVRLAQPFSLRYPLIDGQGNFGSVDGDPPAAMRYTESRMTRLAGEMLADIDSDTVDFTPNYDESTSEPTVLPARIPNLIVNGSTGIAVGMATNIPPHNLTEVLNATIALLQKEKGETRSDLEIVLEHVKGPDFPTGGFLYGRGNLVQTYKTGRGRFMMRAKCGMEQITGGRQAIICTEIPYQVNKSNLIKRIAELVTEKIVDDISDVRDESDRDGMRIVIELKRGAQQEIVLNQLYKHTSMQESFSMIFLAVHNGQPKELPLNEAIWAFIEHRIDVVRRRTAFLLNKAREREHVLLGYQIALDHLDQVIRIIRQSSSRADARENLFSYFSNRRINLRGTELQGVTLDPAKYAIDLTGGSVSAQLSNNTAGTLILSYRQIDAILELQLYRLTQLSIDELLNELRAVRDNISEYESILASEKKLRRVIIKELEDIRDKYGDARRTTILDESTELTLEDLIADEQVAVTVSNTGYLKRTPISTYRQQRRGGTGRLGMKTREEDFVAQLIIDSTHAYLLCFTNSGRVYWLKVYEIPDIGAAGKGKAMASLVDLQPGEKVVTILPVKDLAEEGKYVLFATRNGTVKKTALKDFSNVMARGIIAIGIDKEDELITARITDGEQVIFLATHDGMAIRFNEQDLRPMGRPAFGNRGITLKKNDYVIGAAVTPSNEARNKQRLELAAKTGLTAQVEAVLDEAGESAAAQPLELAEPGELGAPVISEAAAAKLQQLDEKLGLTPCLILSVSDNGYGKRTDVDSYRLQSRGGKGVINMKSTPKIGKVASIQLVDDTTEMMVISQFGKIIRIDTKSVRAAGRATMGVKLLDLDTDDKVAAAMVIPPEDPKSPTENGALLQ
ncbi:DNA gyrase subunit A [Granulicella mallensis]|uniref:DNA gyrase subunit A n=1 Tax=Granulicella mallensis (strain ATCC BAA-1857 / DSM 23137 / MP5ACTX8) TaxID=682795 RepID=G8NXP4_GRAMM|nr:DNA gyrase subunit A [Granulicella mallensis]AEU34389.1 DNA gyrase, A subunit [Granulicella mallensis MP5ACTX8]